MSKSSGWENAGRAVGSFLTVPFMLSVAVSFALLFVKLTAPERNLSWFDVSIPVLIVLSLFVLAMAALVAVFCMVTGGTILLALVATTYFERKDKAQRQRAGEINADDYSAGAEDVLTEAAKRAARKASKPVPFVSTPFVKN